MFRLFLFFMSIWNVLCLANISNSNSFSESILEDKIPVSNFRYQTFAYALNLLYARDASIIVETGTARAGRSACESDGCSTLIFAEWVKHYGGEFYSVDISAQNLQNAANCLGDAKPYATLVHSDSIVFLENFNQPIDFLYLDSYDYEINNPNPSQEHHLNEIIAAYPWLTAKSIVMIDDCALPNGGKGRLVIEYLQARGWKILLEGYQVILSKEESI